MRKTIPLATKQNNNHLLHQLQQYMLISMDHPQKRSTVLQAASSPYRRRRIFAFTLFIVAMVFLFQFGAPWEMSTTLKDAGIKPTGLSRANIAALVKPKVDEIYGLLHFVTRTDKILSSTSVKLDPSKPIGLDVYGSETEDWKKNVEILNTEFPVVVFSKARTFPSISECRICFID
jgi:hypothetical protein